MTTRKPLSPATVSQLDSIPIATSGEFEVSDKEARSIRSYLYAINKDGIRRFRTQREGPYLFVWRIK